MRYRGANLIGNPIENPIVNARSKENPKQNPIKNWDIQSEIPGSDIKPQLSDRKYYAFWSVVPFSDQTSLIVIARNFRAAYELPPRRERKRGQQSLCRSLLMEINQLRSPFPKNQPTAKCLSRKSTICKVRIPITHQLGNAFSKNQPIAIHSH